MKNKSADYQARRRKCLEELYARIEDMSLSELLEMLSIARGMR